MQGAVRSLVVLGLAGVAALAWAQAGEEDVSKPQLFTIEAVVTADQATAEKVGYDSLSVAFPGGGKRRWLGVVGARSLGGDAFQGKETVEGLQLKDPNLLASGPSELVAKLQDAPDGSRVVVQGILEPPTRNYMLGKVDVVGTSAGH